MVIVVMILAIGAGVALVSFSENSVAFGQKKSSQAYRYAVASAHDALLRLARNKSYSCASVDCYSIDMVASGCTSGDGCGKVTVSSDPGSAGSPKVITAKGIVNSVTRRVQVSVVYDGSLNGEMSTITWQELNN